MMDLPRAFVQCSREYLLDEYLPKIEHCVALLAEDDIWWRPNAGSNSVGNLLLHLAGNVRQWIVSGVAGVPDTRERQKEFDAREGASGALLLDDLRKALKEVDGVLATIDSATLLGDRRVQGRDVRVFEAIYHVIEHFSAHTGQIMWITKMRTGKDLNFYPVRDGSPQRNW